MAIIKLGPTIVGIRGTIGGVTYSANKSGPTARMWGKGANPKSKLQTQARAITTQLNVIWPTLTAPQLASWDAFNAGTHETVYNSLGIVINLSGFQWFHKLNGRILTYGGAVQLTAPAGVALPTPPASTLTVTSAGVLTYYSGFPTTLPAPAWPTYARVRQLYTNAIPTAGYKFLGALGSNVTGIVNCAAAFLALFGNPQIGTTVQIQTYYQNGGDGQRAQPSYLSAPVLV